MTTNGLIILSTAIGAGIIGSLVYAIAQAVARVRREPVNERAWETWFED